MKTHSSLSPPPARREERVKQAAEAKRVREEHEREVRGAHVHSLYSNDSREIADIFLFCLLYPAFTFNLRVGGQMTKICREFVKDESQKVGTRACQS